MMNNHWQNGQNSGMFMPGNATHINPSMFNNHNSTPNNLNSGSNFELNPYALPNGANVSQNTAQQSQGQQFNQQFNPASVVPAKRPHDGMSGSPTQQQPQQLPPGSRSQTPQYNSFPGQQSSAPQFPNAPTPYSHLQQPGSNNATPSPTMSSQSFRPPPPQQTGSQAQQAATQGQQQTTQQQQRLNTASPSPFPQHQSSNYNGQMPQMPNTPTSQNSMQQPGQSNSFTPQQNFGMAGPGMSMPSNMQAMQMRMNNMGGMSQEQQRAYQMQMMAKQQQMRAVASAQPQRAGAPAGQMPSMASFPGQQPPGGNMVNGGPNYQQLQYQQQQHATKRAGLFRQLASHANQQGRQFNPTPSIGNKPLDLYVFWSCIVNLQGSQSIEANNQWSAVAQKLGFNTGQYPTAAEELKQIFRRDLALYEQMYNKARMVNRVNNPGTLPNAASGQPTPTQQAQQFPNKSAPTPGPPQQGYQQYPQQAQQQMQQTPNQPPPQSTPVQTNASLVTNGMSTPQPTMGAPGSLQHRRNSSLRKPEQLTPGPDNHLSSATPAAATVNSPLMHKQQRPSSVKRESVGPLMRNEEPQSTNYVPQARFMETDGGYDISTLDNLALVVGRMTAPDPAVEDFGIIDIRQLTLCLTSGIHSEVRYALDALAVLSNDQRLALNLENCEELLEAVVDCAEEQLDILSDDAVEVSDALDLPTYEDVIRGGRIESATLQEVSPFGTREYELDRAADKIIAITTIVRNLSFYEVNHRLLTAPALIKWISNALRLLGTRTMLLRTYLNTQDFYKDAIIFLSNVTQSLELPSRDDALHILQFLLCFVPQPVPQHFSSSAAGARLRFTSFSPASHRYLPPAVDCLAKLLARQEPNREFYRLIFNAPANVSAPSDSSSPSSTSSSPLDLLTQAFALAIAVLPDRTKGLVANAAQFRIVEARKAYLTQGMLAADILSSLAPANNAALARAWLESEDGWAPALLKLSALLSVDASSAPQPPMPGGKGPREQAMQPPQDFESFKLITCRALTMLKRLADRVGKSIAAASLASPAETPVPERSALRIANGVAQDDGAQDGDRSELVRAPPTPPAEDRPQWEGIPHEHAILGAMMLGHVDKVALGLLHDLHELVSSRA